jgi:signal transduction histidine kinase
MDLQIAAVLIVLFFCLAITLLVYLDQKIKKKIKLSFYLLSTGIGLWQLFNVLSNANLTHEMLINRLVFVFPVIALAGFLFFVESLWQIKKSLSNTGRYIDYTLIGLTLILSLSPYVVTGIQARYSNHIWSGYNVVHGPLYLLYILGIGAISAIAIISFLQYYRQTQSEEKRKLKYVLYGFAGSLILALLTSVALPLLLKSSSYSYLSIFSGVLFIASVAYSISRYQFLDIRLFVLRATVYTLSIILLTIFYVLPAILIISVILKVQFTWARFISAIVVAAVVAFFYQWARVWFNKITRRIFFRDAYDPQSFIDAVNKLTVSTLDLRTLLNGMAVLLGDNLKASYCAVGLNKTPNTPMRLFGAQNNSYNLEAIENARRNTPYAAIPLLVTDYLPQEYEALKTILQQNNVAVLAKLMLHEQTEDKSLGYIILGSKKSGNLYDLQDVRILETIINGLIVAIQNALHFEEIQTFNATLQEKVNTATKQLQEANSHLQELDKVKDDFLAMTTHQFNTPLVAIDGYISLVETGISGAVNDKQHALLGQAQYRLLLLKRMVADFLDVSRMEAGRFFIDPAPTNLNIVVAEEANQLQQRAKEVGVTLKVNLPAKPVPIMMLDEQKTRQAIMNLIDNAIHYTPKGSVNVYLEADDKEVTLRVVDNGIGVPQAQQAKLFSKYFRAENAKIERANGNGIGLYLVKRVIEDEGGTVIFSSIEGKGSTFGFRLPFMAITPRPKPAPPSRPQPVAVAV